MPVDPHLEREYKVRALRDDFEQILEDWQARSTEFTYRAGWDLDLEYGHGERDRLDLLRVDKHGPVLIYIHGGYWQSGDKSMYRFVAEPFLARGVNVAVINYDLCPGGDIPGISKQIQKAIIWLWHNAERLGIPQDRMNLCGHSAGGHLTSMMLTTNWSSLNGELPPDLVKSGIPISGVYDLAPLKGTSINDAVGINRRVAKEYSPLYLEPATDAPVLVCVGGEETAAFHGQTEQFTAKWGNYAATVESFVVPRVDHFDVINHLADNKTEFFEIVMSWLK